jgi:hypothetical protein
MPLPPSLAEVIGGAIASRLADVHCCMPGRVKSYDGSKQTAEIVPVIRGVIGTEDGDVLLEDLPVLPNVPVCWMRGGGYSLQFPLNVGDHGLVVFSDASPALWRTSGDTSEPGDLRMHDLSFGFFIPCCAPDSKTLPNAGSAAVLDGPTLIRLGGEAADFVALTTKVTAALNALKSAISSAPTVPQDGGAAFKTALVSALASWPPPVGATKVKAE